MRSKRDLYVSALRILLQGKMSAVVKARDWELLKEISRLATEDAPPDLAITDPALFQSWRAAVTRFHLRGWSNMTPERVEHVANRLEASTSIETDTHPSP